jgi:hypothetical protein
LTNSAAVFEDAEKAITKPEITKKIGTPTHPADVTGAITDKF